MKHDYEKICPSCEEKLKEAHALLGEWFHEMKEIYSNLHISWSYRDETNQNNYFAQGRSQLKYPYSLHNKTDSEGKPCSLALDVFQLVPSVNLHTSDIAVFNRTFYEQLYQESLLNFPKLKWGGKFQTLADFDHFYMDLK